MIVRPRPSLLKLFFILRGSVVQKVWPQIVVVFLLSLLIVWAHDVAPAAVPVFNGAPFTLLGIALSIFLGFRNNACYDRWWEARRVWGELVTASRTFARQTLVLETGEEGKADRRRLLSILITFVQTLVQHLRQDGGKGTAVAVPPVSKITPHEESRNAPASLLIAMSAELAHLRTAGHISDILFQTLDNTVARMEGVLAACERIRNTPVPFGYTLLLHRTAYLFCFLLPFGVADVLNWATPFAAALIAYTFFGLDALGDELEEPFGFHPNGLPIAALATTIEINLREAMGETGLPPLPQPVDFMLH
jgi:ion channel-forming bestrophin family protein